MTLTYKLDPDRVTVPLQLGQNATLSMYPKQVSWVLTAVSTRSSAVK